MSLENPVNAPPPRAEPLAYHTPSSAEEREEIFAELCGYIREDGVATSDAAILAALQWDELLRWLEQFPDYLRRLAQARTQSQFLARPRQSRPVTIDDTLTPENVADLERRRAAARAADAPNIERIEKAARERAAATAPRTPPPPGALDSFARAHLRAHNLTLPPSAFQ